MKLRLVTIYNDGLLKNYQELKSHNLYQQNHSASYFKYLYDQIEKNEELRESKISSIVAYCSKTKNPIAVLFFFHLKNKTNESYEDKEFISIGEVGIYVSPEFRKQGVAKKLLVEFENNFIDFYSSRADYIVVNAFRGAFDASFKAFKWFIPNNKPHSTNTTLKNIKLSIEKKNTRCLKYYLYRKNI